MVIACDSGSAVQLDTHSFDTNNAKTISPASESPETAQRGGVIRSFVSEGWGANSMPSHKTSHKLSHKLARCAPNVLYLLDNL